MAPRTLLTLLALMLVTLTFVPAQPPPGGGGFGGGAGGGGRRGGFSLDPDESFNRFSGGKDVIDVATMDPQLKQTWDFTARFMGFTGQTVTRQEFKDASAKIRERFASGGMGAFGGMGGGAGGGMGNFTRRADGPGGSGPGGIGG